MYENATKQMKANTGENDSHNITTAKKKTIGRRKYIDIYKAVDIDLSNKVGIRSYWLQWNEKYTKNCNLNFPTYINFDDYQHLDCDVKLTRREILWNQLVSVQLRLTPAKKLFVSFPRYKVSF